MPDEEIRTLRYLNFAGFVFFVVKTKIFYNHEDTKDTKHKI